MNHRLPVIIRGTGCYTPQRTITSEHFTSYLDTTDEWITTRTGINERRWAAPEERTSTHGAHAARRALEDAGMGVEDLDAIVCATATGDCQFPATACFIQDLIGAHGIPAFDVSAACAGFLYGSAVAAGLLQTGLYQNVLVVGAETLSRYADPEDRSTIILFGDAGGAAIWSKTDDPDRGILFAELGADGSKAEHIWVPAGGSRLPTSETTVAERLQFLRMKGREVFKFAVTKMEDCIDRAIETLGISPSDLTLFIPHQSNARIIRATQERMGLPAEKVVLNIGQYGNTSAASIPLGLDHARRTGKVKEGDLVLLIAIGAGLTWATMVVKM